jgi:hypothetical protein
VSADDFLRRLVTALDTANVPYMVVGSYASATYGIPRMTHDLDIVIDPDRAGLDRLLAQFPDDAYYADVDIARDALRRRSMFNIIDFATSWKVDLVIRKARPFSISEMSRRVSGTVLDVACMVASREDTILSKLEWARDAGGSERQLDDVRGILAISGDGLDLAYLDHWARELGILDLWSPLRETLPA